MDISALDPSSVPALAPVTPVNTNPVSGTAATASAAASASVVEFSPLAQLLAVTVIFQTRQGQPVPASTAGNQGKASFQQLVEAANSFVNAFNAFQNTINGSYATAFETAFDSALLTAMQQEQNQSGSNPIQSFIDSMAQLGINFQGNTNPVDPNYFQFDLTALEQAYATSPEQTAALLNTAFAGLGTLEEQLMMAQTTEASMTQMAQQMATYSVPANALNAVGANGTAAQVAAIVASTSAPTVATATPPATTAPGTAAAPAVNPAPPTATIPAVTPSSFDPVTLGPLIAQAVAAYRVVENIAPPSADLLNPTPALDTVPDVIETTRIEPIGPDTPKGPALRAKQ